MAYFTQSLIVAISFVFVVSALPHSSTQRRPWWRSHTKTAGRVVGGFEVDIVDVPFQASLDLSVGHYCGASVISNRWVLTAAHCVYGTQSDNLRVRVGSTYHAEGGQVVKTERMLRHPQYNGFTTDYDFALIELAEEFIFGENVSPVELPAQDEPIEVGTCVQVSGWGDTQNVEESSDVLRATNVPVVSQEECSKAYVEDEITPQMVCAGYEKGGKDSCQGDSGGPLVEGKNKLVGVVSWGKGCAREGYPGVYARVASVREWIKQTAGV